MAGLGTYGRELSNFVIYSEHRNCGKNRQD